MTGRSSPRRRLWRGLVALAVLLLLFIGALLGAAWYFSDQLLDVSHAEGPYTVTVVARHGDVVTLTPDSRFADRGRFGLEWPGGETHVGPVVGRSGGDVLRRLLSPTPALLRYTHVQYSVPFFRTPTDVGLAYRSVAYPDRLGRMPAWLVPGSSSTWVIAVHGLGSTRAEPVRPMPVFASLGLPILDIGYRNDAGAPQDGGHLYHLGADEWLDLQQAVRFARAHGARSIVLDGYSMGGAIVETFMQRSPFAHYVRALILDSPALDWPAILNLAASQRYLPGLFAAVTERLIAYRIGLSSLSSLDFLGQRLRVARPTLLFQGTADTLVPPSSNQTFAGQHRRFITYISVPGANHTQSWNMNPRRYDATIRRFLMQHLHCRAARGDTVCH